MDNQPFSNTIYENLKLKETSELMDIWKKNDRQAWSDEAFAAIERILDERQEALPSQGLETDEEEDIQDVDTYHDPNNVLRIVIWMRWLAIALAISTLGYNLFYFFTTFEPNLYFNLYNLLGAVYTLAEDLVKAFLLLAGSQFLLMMLDIEINTRQNKAGPNVE